MSLTSAANGLLAAAERKRVEPDDLKERIKQCKSLSAMSKQDTLDMRLKHVGPSVALFFQEDPLKMVKGNGQYLYDELGNEYLDCINNVAHVGHANKRVADAVGKQMHLLNTNSRFLHDNLSEYARRLVSLFPAHLSVCYLVNSGSEANDLAIRLARAHTHKKDVVCVEGAYHGNLTTTMAISPFKSDKLARGLDARPPKWAHVAPLPCTYRGQFQRTAHRNEAECGRLYAAAAQRVIEAARGRGRQVGAFFVESMISCGGQTPLPANYLRQLQRYLKQIGAVLVCDEVQCGFGRAGSRMWAFQLDGDDIRPDIVTIGKPMGNGFPISAVVTTPDIAQSFKAIGTDYFNTFGGNPASCAAALAVLDELDERRLMDNARCVGDFVLAELRQLQSKSRVIGDVRGTGFFIGLELVESIGQRRPAKEFAQFVVQQLRFERILMSTEGRYGNVLKFKPPMVFTMEDARRFIGALAKTLAELELQLAANSSEAARSSAASSSSSCSSSSWLESSGEL